MTTRVTHIDKNRQKGCYGDERHRYLVEGVGLMPRSRVRLWPFVIFVSVCVVLLGFRLSQLTVVEGAYQRSMAESNRVTAIRNSAARGVFIDRAGTVLVHNIPHYKRQVPGSTLHEGAFEEVSRDEAMALRFTPGERIFYDISREYPCGEACSVLLGYIGEVDRAELDNNPEYVLGDMIGKLGLEKLYERRLRGEPGSELLEVNAAGKLVRAVGTVPQQAGSDVRLTIDVELQKKLYELLEGRKGAAIAAVPQTGEVLALVSSPAFDPHDLTRSLEDEDQPFFNRAIGGAYPPGSVFKVVTAIAGLEEAVIALDSQYEDTGEIVIDEYRFGNWYYHEYGRTEGAVNVVEALKRSNDIFFYHLGGDLGADTLADWAEQMGMGQTTELFGRMGEVAGVVPDPLWKERTKGEKWYLGNTYHMAIGQGDVLTTPFQINRMMGAVAAQGVLCEPVLDQDVVGQQSCVQLNLHPETLAAVTEGLKLACEPGGTGVPFFKADYQVGCKTGTAQQGGEEDLPHAWFSVYAPLQEPEIVVTVMLEHVGEGSDMAAPVAKELLDYYFLRK